MNDLLSLFPEPVAAEAIPTLLPSPFADQPHPLARSAAMLLQQRLENIRAWPRDYSPEKQGKMFGVLVVRDREGRIGYLSAFSGMIGGEWRLPGFVPQLFDLTAEAESLSFGNDELASLTTRIEALENDPGRTAAREQLESIRAERELALAALKTRHAEAKAKRKQQRQALRQEPDESAREQAMAALALASQHHKREATNAREAWQQQLQAAEAELERFETGIEALKSERTSLSQRLHRQFFDTYRLGNWLGEEQTITRFFSDTTPPAGAGDCAGPKLLHHARCHGLQPLAMAEFWWGASPSTGVRNHGRFYPACRGKCHPILPFMLRGLDVEPEPEYAQAIDADEPRIVFEDDYLLVLNKPAGLMSAPGKHCKDSVLTRLQQRYPDCPDIKLVHRLDMATSGLLLAAKRLDINKQLQRQFIERSVEKCYEALLARRLPGEPAGGEIDLPLRVDFDDRPRQVVCHRYGKQAVTRWQFIAHEGAFTRVRFYPLTGRTHQLRMHAAHRDGLNAAIVGDALYGEAAERLMLHARQLAFTHPVSRKRLSFEISAPF